MKSHRPYRSHLVFLGLVVGCHSSPSTSSSSNWLSCRSVSDCPQSSEAVGCVQGYCVDEEGNRISRQDLSDAGDSGGSSPGGATGGGESSGGDFNASSGGSTALGSGGSGGREQSGGADTGDGGQAMGGAGSGGEPASGGSGAQPAECEGFDALAACDTDDDCTSGLRLVDCCGGSALIGVNVDQVDEFETKTSACSNAYPACGCAAPPFPTAEDGRYLVEGEVAVRCDAGSCKTSVPTRTCGDLTCTGSQVCVAVQTVVPQSEHEYGCVDNPCGQNPLDCECAEGLCNRPDAVRLCSSNSYDVADIFCQDTRQ